jgi:type IV pilus assembly protein PilM
MTVGVDIGEYSVQLAVLEGERVIQVCSEHYPDMQHENTEQQVQTLSRMTDELKLRGEFAWGAIYGTPVLTRLSQFSSMEPEELRQAVSLEVEQLQSRELNDLDIDYAVLEERDDGSNQVLIVAAPQQQSNDLMDILEKSNLRCRGVTVNTVALGNQLLRLPDSGETSSMLLDVGATHTSILVQHRGNLKVLRDVSFGAGQITEAVADDMGIDLSELENTKRAYTESTEEFMAALRRSIQPLRKEIKRTIGHVKRSTEHLTELAVHLAGGGSLTPGLRHYLSRHLEVEVDYLDPFQMLEADCELPDDPTHRAAYSVAVGAAWLGENT